MPKYLKIILLTLFVVFGFNLKAYAGVCKIGDTIFTEPPAGIFTAVDWAGIFPIRIGGRTVVPGIPDDQDYLPPACLCQRLPPPAPPILIGNIPAQSTDVKIPAGGSVKIVSPILQTPA